MCVCAVVRMPVCVCRCGSNLTHMGTCEHRDKHLLDYMGYTIRTDQYRYTEWVSVGYHDCMHRGANISAGNTNRNIIILISM